MLDPWEEILALEKERQRCADDVETVKASCIKDHKKNHVSQCPECWTRLVNRIRDRYLNPSTKEWFSGRRLFLQELDTMFSAGHERKIDIRAIEQRIAEEKVEWFRDRVRSMGLQSATKTPADAKNLQQKLNDRTIPADQIASELRGSFSDGVAANKAALEGFLKQLRAAKSPQERIEAYVDIFFQPNHDTQGAERAKKYIDLVRNGTPVLDMIHAMQRDRQSAKGTQEKKQALQKKIEELKRAKAANELSKAKKEKMRQDKAAAAAELDPNYNIPPCLNCGKVITDGYEPCIPCVVLADYGAREQKTVFCSPECYDQAYDEHEENEHECAADQFCIDNQDNDVDMDEDGGIEPVFCVECLEAGREAIFCCAQCYEANFQRHREWVHLSMRRRAGMDIDDEHQLEFTSDDNKKSYRPRRIEDHCIAMTAAMEAHCQKTGAKLQ